MKTTLSPLLNVRRGAKAIEFYKAAFGAEEIFSAGAESGSVVAQMSINGAEFWLADSRLRTPTSARIRSAAAPSASFSWSMIPEPSSIVPSPRERWQFGQLPIRTTDGALAAWSTHSAIIGKSASCSTSRRLR